MGARAARLFLHMMNDTIIPLFYGQSDSYYVAKRDFAAFVEHGKVMLRSQLFLEIAVPTLYATFMNTTSTRVSLHTEWSRPRRAN